MVDKAEAFTCTEVDEVACAVALGGIGSFGFELVLGEGFALLGFFVAVMVAELFMPCGDGITHWGCACSFLMLLIIIGLGKAVFSMGNFVRSHGFSPTELTHKLGFDHAAFDSNAVFRVLLDAMSRPGRIYDLPVSIATPDGLNASATATLLAMADMDTTIWLSPSSATKAANDHLKFHCGCPISDDVAQADFAVARIDDDLSFITRLSMGNAEYPDQSATLILMVDEISNAPAMKLTGLCALVITIPAEILRGLPSAKRIKSSRSLHMKPWMVRAL